MHQTEKRQKQLMSANTNETKEEDKEDNRSHGHPEFLLKRKLEMNFLANSALIRDIFFFFFLSYYSFAQLNMQGCPSSLTGNQQPSTCQFAKDESRNLWHVSSWARPFRMRTLNRNFIKPLWGKLLERVGKRHITLTTKASTRTEWTPRNVAN